ncbi:MAG: SMC-Scp complex subunit ScpB, partial [Patescibacteria group bacterium]
MLTVKLEAILFAIAKPITIDQLKKQLGVSSEILEEAVQSIEKKYNTPESGIHLFQVNGSVQFVSNPDVGEEVSQFLKKEASGPLTRPSLETLAVIAYRGPVTKPEIEQVRGVNCGIILRNLLIR